MSENDGDPRSAIARFLKEEVAKAEGRVYRPGFPTENKELMDAMPQACIVVYSGGGGHLFGGSRMGVFDSVLDIACHGSTRLEAEEVADEAIVKLRQLAHITLEDCYLHWARIAAGMKSAIDSVTLWPIAVFTTQVMHSIPEE